MIGVEPDTVKEPVILASPFLEPSHSLVGRLVKPDPSPWKEPEKEDPEIAIESVKSIIELEAIIEPVIIAFPKNGKGFKSVKLEPSP